MTDKTWYPKPGDVEHLKAKSLVNDPDKHETPLIDTSKAAECNKTLIVTKLSETIDRNNASTELMTYFDSKDHDSLVKVDFISKGTVVIHCRTWKECKYLADTYKDKKLFGKELTFTLFSETDPDSNL